MISCGEGLFPSKRLAQMAAEIVGEDESKEMLDLVYVHTVRNVEEQLEVSVRQHVCAIFTSQYLLLT
jgi:2-polyprenyl-3-methyl-5-hydroxy-6-metoxy-1,4-benzoquinol methylase